MDVIQDIFKTLSLPEFYFRHVPERYPGSFNHPGRHDFFALRHQ